MNVPNKKIINKAVKNDNWDFCNKILYDLCQNNFQHKEVDKISSKILIIGRTYAAALERRKNKKSSLSNEDFCCVFTETTR